MKDLVLNIIFTYKKLSLVLRTLKPPLLFYADCKFYPTCSDYAIRAIQKYGVVKGSTKSFLRILKCSPFLKGGIDMP
ncbi:MAG: membrane protein insertion efficiency factor YidD [Candidatus Yanofskybacteria bacterium RIFCSPHIGHO2_02_FULL_41_11]|uniref:Putative membrane protein insertion efficiency factor n=1 Tax=Candidatus Yanofskybacteria bacterium RIFCSPHIGHO2_02_FULL_41_11 TaxID=1802675 RepID=A0A1F8F9S5_9BACT|nr:MAG: membrane protein insertion efficiency factor YidD [Candidatus Yanofskybacteria bacterium RIFCSPHIGHO2_02_FULL_41_11]